MQRREYEEELKKLKNSYEATVLEQKNRIFELRERLEAQELLAEKYLTKAKAINDALIEAQQIAEGIIEDAKQQAKEIILRSELASRQRDSEISRFRSELSDMEEQCRRVIEALEGSIGRSFAVSDIREIA